MPINHAALKTELLTDPLGLGYAPLLATGDNVTLAATLNAVLPATTVPRGLVGTWELVGATVRAEWVALTALEREFFSVLVSAVTLDLRDAGLRAHLGALFGAGTATRANLIALSTKPASRAEVLFGADAVVSHTDVGEALGS